jgi:hypothetical protein
MGLPFDLYTSRFDDADNRAGDFWADAVPWDQCDSMFHKPSSQESVVRSRNQADSIPKTASERLSNFF